MVLNSFIDCPRSTQRLSYDSLDFFVGAELVICQYPQPGKPGATARGVSRSGRPHSALPAAGHWPAARQRTGSHGPDIEPVSRRLGQLFHLECILANVLVASRGDVS
jgi:hypothetical protein